MRFVVITSMVAVFLIQWLTKLAKVLNRAGAPQGCEKLLHASPVTNPVTVKPLMSNVITRVFGYFVNGVVHLVRESICLQQLEQGEHVPVLQASCRNHHAAFVLTCHTEQVITDQRSCYTPPRWRRTPV